MQMHDILLFTSFHVLVLFLLMQPLRSGNYKPWIRGLGQERAGDKHPGFALSPHTDLSSAGSLWQICALKSSPSPHGKPWGRPNENMIPNDFPENRAAVRGPEPNPSCSRWELSRSHAAVLGLGGWNVKLAPLEAMGMWKPRTKTE